MARDEQFENPYAPPASRAEPPKVERDELHDMLERAFYAATYGTFFFPGLGYLVSVFLLVKAHNRRAEFSPIHQKLFDTTAMICGVLLVLICGAAALMAADSLFQWSRHL